MRVLLLVMSLLSIIACTKKTQKEFRLFTWSEYFSDEFIQEFERENNVKVRLDYMSSNEQLLAKLQVLEKTGEVPDLIMPSDYMVGTLVEGGLLQPLEKSKLTFLSEFEETALNPSYDPDLKHSVPVALGSTGLAVNTKMAKAFNVKKGISWKELLENPTFKNQVTLIDDPREILNVALLIQGKKFSEATDKDIRGAFEYLRKKKANIKAFTAETRPVIEGDECAFCQAYSGDVLNVATTKKEIVYVIPKEGGAQWTDNFAIPKSAKHTDLAYAFMNKLLVAEGAKNFTMHSHYRTANKKARELLEKEITENTMIFPTQDMQDRLRYLNFNSKLMSVLDEEITLFKSQ